MISSDFRKEAREKLEGKWGKAALIMLVYTAIVIVFSYISQHTTGLLNTLISIAVCVVEVPLAYGLVISYMRLFDGQEVGAFDFFTLGFDNFKRSWVLAFRVVLKVLLPFILVIVSYVLIGIGTAGALTSALLDSSSKVTTGMAGIGVVGVILAIVSYIWLIMKTYYYQLSQFVAIDNPALSEKDSVEESRRLMEGKRWKLFCLQFSFIGWAILAALTFGIGLLWLAPYMQLATISFYKHTLDKTEVKTEAPKEETPVEEVQE